MLLIAAVGVVLVISLTIPIALRPLLVRRGIVDIPNDRSSHNYRAIRGVGVGPLLAVVVGLAILAFGTADVAERALVWVILSVCAASGLLGWLEDTRGVPVVLRASGQLVIGITGAAVVIATVDGSWWLIPVFGLWIAAYMNVTNFMDGVNGISGLHGVVVGIAYALLGVLMGIDWLTIAGSILAVAFAGFLPWNVIGKGMFLGDVGSYLLGGAVAVIAVAAIVSGAPILAVVGPLTIYLADTGVTLMRRVARGERWFEAHRSHVYQRLTDYGLSHLQAALIVTSASAVAGALGLFSTVVVPEYIAILVAAMALVIAGYFVLAVGLHRKTATNPGGSFK